MATDGALPLWAPPGGGAAATSPWASPGGELFRFNAAVLARVAAAYRVPPERHAELLAGAAAHDDGDRYLNARELKQGAERVRAALDAERAASPPRKRRRSARKQPPADDGAPDWRAGQAAVYASTAHGPMPCTVRFRGDLPGVGEVVGVELAGKGPGRHDGGLPGGARGFSTGELRGLYLRPDTPRLTVVRRCSAEQQRVLSVASQRMEERVEARVCRRRAQRRAQERELRAAQERCGDEPWAERWAREVRGTRGTQREGKKAADFGGPREGAIGAAGLTAAEARAVLEHVTVAPNAPLHPAFLLSLVQRCTALWGNGPAVTRVDVPAGGRLHVLGDTHGHLKDVIHAFHTFGTPAPDNVYVVNGDVCDRGDTPGERQGLQCVSIWAVLLTYKVLHPRAVHFNRGNHEDWSCNCPQGGYGQTSFHAGIHAKYQKYSMREQLKAAFRDLFYALPLATVVGGRVLVLHGGLWRACGGRVGDGFEDEQRCLAVRLDELDACDRRRDLPDDSSARGDMLLNDCVWNDPTDDDVALQANDRSDDVRCFGNALTRKFLEENGLALLVRSHEVTPAGAAVRWCHHDAGAVRTLGAAQKGLCLTLFTASNYCGVARNRGGALVFRGGMSDWGVEQWSDEEAMRSWRSAIVAKTQEEEEEAEREAALAQSVAAVGLLQLVRGLIVEHKKRLLAEFRKRDRDRDLHLPAPQWAAACKKVMGDLPWEGLLPEVASVEKTSKQVCYAAFLARHQVRFRNAMGRHAGFQRAITDRLFEWLLLEDRPLAETLAAVDGDGDGTVGELEFAASLAASRSPLSSPRSRPRGGKALPPVSPGEAAAVLRSAAALPPPALDLGAPAAPVSLPPKLRRRPSAGEAGRVQVPVDEFLATVQLRFSATHAKPTTPETEWVPGHLPAVAKDVIEVMMGRQGRAGGRLSASQLMRGFFEEADKDRSGYLEPGELRDALRGLPSCSDLPPKKLRQIVEYCDFNSSGRVNYLEFLMHFNAGGGGGGADASGDLLEAVHSVLHFHYADLLRSAVEGLAPGAARCTPQLFGAALDVVNKAERLLTQEQAECLVGTLTVDDDGAFDVDDYFASFAVIDTERDAGDFDEF